MADLPKLPAEDKWGFPSEPSVAPAEIRGPREGGEGGALRITKQVQNGVIIALQKRTKSWYETPDLAVQKNRKTRRSGDFYTPIDASFYDGFNGVSFVGIGKR